MLLQLVNIIANLSYWVAYVWNGEGLSGALLVGQIIDVFTRSLFILMLMLMAKGWTISSDELTGKFFVVAIVIAYTILDGTVLILKYGADDPAATSPNRSITILRYVIIIVWVALAAWFNGTIYKSYKKEVPSSHPLCALLVPSLHPPPCILLRAASSLLSPSSLSPQDNPVKKALYRNLALAFVPWFFGLPIATLLTKTLDPWVAQRIIETVTLLVSTAAYMVLSFLLWPSRAEEYFNISTPVMRAQIEAYEQL